MISFVKPFVNFSSEFIYRKVMLDFKETHTCVLTDEKWFVFVLEQSFI